MQCRVEVGLLILSLAFVASFFGGLGVAIDLGEYRIIPLLEANPHRCLEYMRDVFLFWILPLTVGLAYSIIAFVRERKSPTGVLKWWLPLTVVGGFFFFWGVYGLRWTYTHYLDVIYWVNAYGPVEIADLILKVCLAVIVGHILWLFAGVLFMLSPMFKMMLREKEAPQQIKLRFLCGKGVTTCLFGLKEWKRCKKPERRKQIEDKKRSQKGGKACIRKS